MKISDLPFGSYLETTSKLEILEPAALAKHYDDYSPSMDIDKPLTCLETMNNYLENRFKSFNDLASLQSEDGKPLIKTIDGSPLAQKLQADRKADPAHINEVQKTSIRASFDTALTIQPKDRINTDITNYNNLVNNINELVQEKEITAIGVTGYLQELRSDIQSQLKKQHKVEIARIEALFAHPHKTRDELAQLYSLDAAKEADQPKLDALVQSHANSLANLAAVHGLDHNNEDHLKQLNKLKDNIISNLKNTHQQQLKEVDKVLQNELIERHRLAQLELDRVSWLAEMEKDPLMRAAIDRAIRKLPPDPNAPDAEFSINVQEGSARFKGIRIQDLDYVCTILGRKITVSGDLDNPTYSIKLPLIGALFYNSPHQNILYEFTSVARLTRARGCTTITTSVYWPGSDNKHEFAMELGRKQYEAAVRAKFDPTLRDDPNNPGKKISNIKVKVNGEIIPVEELFAAEPQRLKKINDKYYKENKIIANKLDNPHGDLLQKQQEVKTKLEARKQEALAQELANNNNLVDNDAEPVANNNIIH